jgi:hypothetical protein
MAFVVFFILITLAIPLSGEIYKKGSDNLIVRSREEAQELTIVVVSKIKDRFGPMGENILRVASLLIGLGISVVLIWVVFRIGSVLMNFMHWFHR